MQADAGIGWICTYLVCATDFTEVLMKGLDPSPLPHPQISFNTESTQSFMDTRVRISVLRGYRGRNLLGSYEHLGTHQHC